MVAVEPLLGLLGVVCVALLITAALLVAALRGRGPFYGRLVVERQRHLPGPTAPEEPRAEPEAQPESDGIVTSSTIRFLARERRYDPRS
jgi:hypothetical protein